MEKTAFPSEPLHPPATTEMPANAVGAPAGRLLVLTEGLVKTYNGKNVVDGVDIKVRSHEIVGLLGPNGAGKTTTFYMITGLIKPNAGRVMLVGEDVTHHPMFRRSRLGLGYLSQEPSIFRRLTVKENILAILETLDLNRRQRMERLDELLNELSIAHLADQRAYTLSGGERRRLEITRALVTNPVAIMLDEPFAGVDPKSVEDVQEILVTLRNRGLGVLISDHSVRETLQVVDRAYIMYEGKVLREGTSDYLINDEASREMYLGSRFTM